ncbi:MAG: hypothetical protein AB4060_08235 [Crocosphaera sp.]
MIPFTDREMQKACRQNKSAYHNATIKTNAHRLLLFYSVECGLKAVIMKRKRKNRTDLCQEIGQSKHDINKLLSSLRVSRDYMLPKKLSMKHLKTPRREDEERTFTSGKINQMWRYGGCSENIKDHEIEDKLLNIVKWIEQELGNL